MTRGLGTRAKMWWNERKLTEAERAVLDRAWETPVCEWQVSEQRYYSRRSGLTSVARNELVMTFTAQTEKGAFMTISRKPDIYESGAAYHLYADVPSGSTIGPHYSIGLHYETGLPWPKGVPRVKALYQRLHNHFIQAVERQQADEKRKRQKDEEDEERKRQKEQKEKEDDFLQHF